MRDNCIQEPTPTRAMLKGGPSPGSTPGERNVHLKAFFSAAPEWGFQGTMVTMFLQLASGVMQVLW